MNPAKREHQRGAVRAFFRAIDQGSYLIQEDPGQFFPQTYNRMPRGAEANPLLRGRLGEWKDAFAGPWFRLLTRPAAESAVVRVLAGHADRVNSCDASPDGRRIASAGDDGVLKIWDAETGKEILSRSLGSGPVRAARYSPDGWRLLTADDGGALRLWDAETGRELAGFKGHAGSIAACVFSRDGRYALSAGTDKTLIGWDARSGEAVRRFVGHRDDVLACAFSPDGTIVVSAGREKDLRIWDFASGRAIASLKGHTDWIYFCCFSPDGTRILSSSGDETWKIWDVGSGRVLVSASHGRPFEFGKCPCAFSPDGAKIVSGGSWSEIMVWDAADGRRLETLKGHADFVRDCAFFPDGETLVSAGDKTLRIWSLAEAESLAGEEAGAAQRMPLAGGFGPRGILVAEATSDARLRLRGLDGGGPAMELKPRQGRARKAVLAAFSRDGRFLAAGGQLGTIRIWDTSAGTDVARLIGHSRDIVGCAFSGDAGTVVSASADGSVWAWDVATEKPKAVMKGHQGLVAGCAVTSDGARIVSISSEWLPESKIHQSEIRLWDGVSGRELALFRAPESRFRACVLAPDDETLALVDSGPGFGRIRFWKISAWRELTFQFPHESANICAFSPDGRLLLTGGGPPGLKLWGLESKKELAAIRGLTGDIQALAFGPDGRRILLLDSFHQVLLGSIENIAP